MKGAVTKKTTALKTSKHKKVSRKKILVGKRKRVVALVGLDLRSSFATPA